MSNIWHTRPSCVPSLHGCGWPFCLGQCFLNLLDCLHHWFFQSFFFLLVNNIFCFLWLSILEHLFFSCLTSCCNINIHHIHIYSDCLCHNNRLNFYYCHKFPMKHLLHLNKLWTVYHFMSIQSAYENVFCSFWFSCVAYVVAIMVCSFFFLYVSTLWLIIWQFVQYLLVFLVLLYVFGSGACLIYFGIESTLLAFAVVMPSSHNIATSLCCCNVELLSQSYFERVWAWDSHYRNGDLGVLRDSRKFRVRLIGSKHLAMGRSLYHWKAIEV